MKTTKKLIAFCLLLGSIAGYGDGANKLLSFYTKGPDHYADGNVVLDNEWYALVWSDDGDFGGVDVNLDPVRDGDRVVLMAPLAENGHCPYTVFQIDSQSDDNLSSGKYAIYLLDTRNVTLSSPSKAQANGKPRLVNGLSIASEFEAGSVDAVGTSVKGGSETWVASDDSEVKKPVITGFRLVNGRIELTVADLQPNVKYNIQMGTDPTELTTYGLTVPQTGDNTVFNLDPQDATFFQVVREGMKTTEGI